MKTLKPLPRLYIALTLLAALLLGVTGTAIASSTATSASVSQSIARSSTRSSASPILFVTQVPVPTDFTTIGAVFGNHKAGLQDVARGGDLWIRYPDGTLRNLTQEAGFGGTGLQGATAIAVRDPSVHWSGKKAVFSMVIGAPTQQYQVTTQYWQLYEVSGFDISQTVVITKVPNQPANFNNISPVYGTDDRILFTSDRPRTGATQLYPQLDEYELAPTVSGLWSLNPGSGDLFMLDHAPSGDFSPSVDSFGRVVFTRWDHMQRDQEADDDAGGACGNAKYGTFNYSDESASASYDLQHPNRAEVYPEPRSCRTDLLAGTNLNGHAFNQFFPWQVLEDGTQMETLNHLGRHELAGYFDVTFNNDPNLVYHSDQTPRTNSNSIGNMLQIQEDARQPGVYFAIDAPEFGTHASGQVISITAPPALNADTAVVGYVTHRDTASYTDTPSPNHSGLYRNPLPMSDGNLVVAHTFATQADSNTGTRSAPKSRYDYRLKVISQTGAYYTPVMTLTAGISKTISYWDPDELVSYSGNLWEWMPVEVRARPRPTRLTTTLAAPEASMFAEAGVSLVNLETWLVKNDLALAVTRNVTSRDKADLQQPYNLHVPGGVQTVGTAGKIYDVTYVQYFQADQLRGYAGASGTTPNPGRRVLAQPMHDSNAVHNNPSSGGPAGSVVIAPDGSQAAFVPARRALTWQLTDSTGTGIVRERYWVTLQPGEVRTCTACHGVNTRDQAGAPPSTNPPQALKTLLNAWKKSQTPTGRDKFVYVPLIRR